MDALERIEAERECLRLVTRYCHLVDHGAAAEIADLFTDDGVWTSPENTMSGREQILRGFQYRQDNKARMSRHVCNNFLVDFESDEKASGTVYLTLYRHDGEEGRRLSPLSGPAMVGEYRDTFVKTSDGWRISRREIEVNFLASDGAAT